MRKRGVCLGPSEDCGKGSLHQQDGKACLELSAVRSVTRSLKKLKETLGCRY